MKTISIKSYLTEIYNDFKDYIDECDKLCPLMSVNYSGGKLPDYNDIHIQQLYLLRYAFAYAFDYKNMYSDLFEDITFSDKIKVVSVGCGNMIDYWALTEVLKETDNSECIIDYTGVDIIDWNYKFPHREQDNVKFGNMNVAEIFQNSPPLSSDIYIFPKSISEISEKDFDALCEVFAEKDIIKDEFHILISLRENSHSMDIDMERTEKLINSIKKNNYATNKSARNYTYYIDKQRGIKGIDYSFDYPNEAKALLNRLSSECNNYSFCEESCENVLNRNPRLTVGQTMYQIFTFRKEEK